MGRIGLLMIVGGGVLGFFGYQEWRVSRGASATPEAISLQKLIDRGPEGNPHVQVNGFVPGNDYYIEQEEKSGRWRVAYLPVFPLKPEYLRPDAPAPTGPVPVLLKSTEAENEQELQQELASPAVQGLVINRIDSLGSEEKRLLSGKYPGTDFDKCLIIQIGRKPASRGKVAGFLGGGTALIVVGVLVMVVAYKKSGSVI